MGLSPDEDSVEQLYPLQSPDIFQAQGEQLGTFKLARGPWGPHVAITFAAMLEGQILWDALGNVYFLFQAVDAGI